MTDGFSAEASATFVSLGGETILFRLLEGKERGYLAIVFTNAVTAAEAVGRAFEAEETLGATLAAVAPASRHEILTDAPARRASRGTTRSPCAVVLRGPIETLPSPSVAVHTVAAFMEEDDVAVTTIDPGLSVLHEWRSPDGCMARLGLIQPSGTHLRLEHEGLPDILVFQVEEVPDLMRALSAVAPAHVHACAAPMNVRPFPAPASVTPGPRGSHTARSGGRANAYQGTKADRVVLARLYAAYPDGVTASEMEDLTTETGLPPGLAAPALRRLSREGRVVSRDGAHFITPEVLASV